MPSVSGVTARLSSWRGSSRCGRNGARRARKAGGWPGCGSPSPCPARSARLRGSISPLSLPTAREQTIRAGRNAERRVADELAEALDDEWMLLRGYCNSRGEIDALLLGPRGLFAIEEKYRSIRVYIRGDEWVAEQIDKYGNPRSARFPIRDRKRRSPSEQVNEPMAALSRWLSTNKRGTPITPVVLLTHPGARVGNHTGCDRSRRAVGSPPAGPARAFPATRLTPGDARTSSVSSATTTSSTRPNALSLEQNDGRTAPGPALHVHDLSPILIPGILLGRCTYSECAVSPVRRWCLATR